MVFPTIAAVGEGGVDTALGGVGVGTDGVDLADDGYISALFMGGDGGAHARESRAYHQYVML